MMSGMPSRQTLSRIVALLAGIALMSGAVSATEGRAGEAGWSVRPEGPEECHALSARLANLPGSSNEPSRTLGVEGTRLCRDGYLRAGSARLRRAIHLARSGGG